MPFERMALFKDEGEERQSLISGLESILIKGRCFDEAEMAWNHLYFSAIQAVSFPALNSTLFKDEIYYFDVLIGCKTPHPVTYFAGNELQIIYEYMLDPTGQYSILINSTSKTHKGLAS